MEDVRGRKTNQAGKRNARPLCKRAGVAGQTGMRLTQTGNLIGVNIADGDQVII